MNHSVVLGDAHELIRRQPDRSFDLICSDPPYGVQIAEWDSDVPPQWFLTECLRVSAGPVVWFGASPSRCLAGFLRYDPMPDRMLIWAPALSFTRTRANGMFHQFHCLWVWRPPEKQDVLPRDVLRHNTAGRHWWDHPCTKPLDLMKDLVQAFCPAGGSVLDPFAGSGTTLVAAAETGRSAVGWEIDPAFAEVARKRVSDALADPPLIQAMMF